MYGLLMLHNTHHASLSLGFEGTIILGISGTEELTLLHKPWFQIFFLENVSFFQNFLLFI
jgi:hypothetical protein